MVSVLAQTSDGFLWLGSPAGLYRFDGVRFERIDSVGGIHLLGESISAVEASKSGGLWIGYIYGGVSFVEGGAIKNYPLETGLPRGTVESLAVDLDGTVWAGTSRGLARLDGQRWTDVTATLGLPSPFVEQVLADKTGALWIRSGRKVAVLPRGSSHARIYTIPAENSFQKDPGGRVWTMQTTPLCLFLLDATRELDPPCRPLPTETLALWLIDRSGNLWLEDRSEHMRLLAIPESDAPQSITPSISNRPFILFFNGGEPNGVLQDREGNIWFGTASGLEQLRVSRLRSHETSAKIVVLAAGSHNSLWLGTTRWDGPKSQDFFRLEEGLMVPYAGGPTQITASYRDPAGTSWVGGYGRVWKLDDGQWREIAAPPELKSMSSPGPFPAQSIARDSMGGLWLSVTRAGLIRLHNLQWERVLVPEIPNSEYPSVIYADANGSVWLGYPHARLASLAGGEWRLHTEKDGITVGNIQALGKVDDEIWLGGDEGLERIRAGKLEPLRTLSPLGGITGFLQARNGDLWLSTSIGAIHIAGQELGQVNSASSHSPAYETFDFLDGMPGVAEPIRPLPTVLQSDDGRIWFEVNNSYAFIDPTEHRSNALAPTVMLRSVTDDGRLREVKGPLTLFANVRNVAIEYTATSLSIPNRVRFKYRLEGFEQSWQDVGTRRAAYYNNLPPGHYVFQVTAANDDGVWNERSRHNCRLDCASPLLPDPMG